MANKVLYVLFRERLQYKNRLCCADSHNFKIFQLKKFHSCHSSHNHSINNGYGSVAKIQLLYMLGCTSVIEKKMCIRTLIYLLIVFFNTVNLLASIIHSSKLAAHCSYNGLFLDNFQKEESELQSWKRQRKRGRSTSTLE